MAGKKNIPKIKRHRTVSNSYSLSYNSNPVTVRMNGRITMSTSLDALDDDRKDDFQSFLEICRSKIDILETQQQEMETFEIYYYETRRKVRKNARELITKIRMHEERLLEEIDASKQSEYAKVTFTKEELDKALKKLNGAYIKGANLSEDGEETDIIQEEVTKEFETLDGDERFSLSALMKFSVLSFSPVRCNTAFGSITVNISDVPNDMISCNTSQKERNTSVASLPCPERVKLHAGRLKSRTSSLSTLLGETITYPALALGALAVPPATNLNQSPMASRKSPMPLIKHLQMKEQKEKEGMILNYTKATHLWSISVDGSQPGQISGPNDVDFLPDGNVLVCDRDNQRLQVFDQMGEFVRIVASGNIKPRRLAVISDGHIVMTDSNDNTVKVYDTKDDCIIIWGKKWYKSIFKDPCGIAINSKEQPIVTDMERRSVIVYDEEGKKIKQLVCEGGSKTDFHSPSYVTVDSHDRIIVSDSLNQSVKVFNQKGKYLFQFNKIDNATRLKYPNGVCTDENGNIYVADWGNHRVSKFDQRGIFLSHVLTKDDGLNHPAGIAIFQNLMAVTAYSDLHSYVGLFKLSE